MKFTQFSKTLQEGVEPVYLIEGDDAYFRDCAVNAVRAALKITQPLLNDVRYEGESLKGEGLSAFSNGLYTLPFFDEKRLVRAYNFYPTEREWEGVMRDYCQKPCPSIVLLIVNGGKRANGVDLKKKKGVVFVDCARESEEMLSRWLFQLMNRLGLKAESDACMLAVRYACRDAARLKCEAEKLKALLGEGGRVTRAVVEENVAKDAEYKIYEMTQAASQRNFQKFSEVLFDMTKRGSDEASVLFALTSHFKTLTQISRLRGGDEAVAKKLNLNPYAVKKNRECIRLLSGQRCEELYRALYALSAGTRSGKYSKTGALDAAIAEIFFGL